MVIRFSCPHCSYVMGVPEAKAGTIGTCPQCKNRVEAPYASEMTGTASLSVAGTTSAGTHHGMKFFCGDCGAILEKPKANAGTHVTCPMCKSQVPVPQTP